MIPKSTLLSCMILLSCTFFAQINRPLRPKILDIKESVMSIDMNSIENDNLSDKLFINNILANRHSISKVSQSTNILKQHLDSTVAPLNYKEVSVHNTKGQETKYTTYKWSFVNKNWVSDTQEEYGYDQYGYSNFYSFSNWNSTTNSYVVGIKKEQSFNKLGNETSYSEFRLNTVNELQGVQKVETTYDATDINVLAQDFYDWNITTKSWDLTENDVIEYDAFGNWIVAYVNRKDTILGLFRTYIEIRYEFDKYNNLAKTIESDRSDVTGQLELAYKTDYLYSGNQFQKCFSERIKGAWQYKSKYTITYRPDSKPESVLTQNWNNTKASWVNDYREDNAFNDLNQNTSWMKQNWDTISSSWIPEAKKEYTYQTSGVSETYLFSTWDATASKWQGGISINQKNDENGNLMKYIAMGWDHAGLKWYGRLNIEFTHNLNFSSNQILSFMNAYDHPNMVLTLTDNKWVNNDWVLKSKADFYYSEQDVTGVNETTKNSFILYPNPAKNTVTIAIDGLKGLFEIFNLQGSKVLSNILTNWSKVNVESLNRGTYIFKISYNGISKIGKFIKE